MYKVVKLKKPTIGYIGKLKTPKKKGIEYVKITDKNIQAYLDILVYHNFHIQQDPKSLYKHLKKDALSILIGKKETGEIAYIQGCCPHNVFRQMLKRAEKKVEKHERRRKNK